MPLGNKNQTNVDDLTQKFEQLFIEDGDLDDSHPWKDIDPSQACEKGEFHFKIAEGKYTMSEKWKTGEKKVDIEKILKDFPNYVLQTKKTSDPYLELEKVIRSIVQLPLFEKFLDKIRKTEKLVDIEKVPKDLQNDLPLTNEILDKITGQKKTSNATNSAVRFSANAFQRKESEGSKIQAIDLGSYIVQISLPEKLEKLVPDPNNRHVFIPSYSRANSAQLDWSKAGIDEKNTHRILVVRPSEFEEYKEWHGNRFPIISLPNNEIGIGYARYWIQKIATHLKLRYIWMIDDSVKRFYDSDKKWEIEFEDVFSAIEKVVEKFEIAAMSPAVFNGWKVGSKVRFERKSPRVAVFLDLKRINEKGVYYRPQLVALEDMIFGAECEKAGLKVLLWNRIRTFDLPFQNTGANSPYHFKKGEKQTEEPTNQVQYRGLENQDNNCWLNTLLQCIHALNCSLNFFSEVSETDVNRELMKCFVTDLKKLGKRNEKAFFPEKLLEFFVNDSERMFESGRQEDINEAYNFLLKCWMNEKSIQDSFIIKTQYVITCSECGNCTEGSTQNKNEEMISFSDSESNPTVESLLSKSRYDRAEMPCTKCETSKDCQREEIVISCPEILTISIKRFHYNEKEGKTLKIKTPVKLNKQLKIPVGRKSQKVENYRLRACALHSGKSVKSGHYTALIFEDDDSDHEKQIIIHIDDAKEAKILNSMSDKKQSVYMVFYVSENACKIQGEKTKTSKE